DKGGDEKKFKEINEAYQVLGDAKKRAQYDQYGRVFEGGMPGGNGQGFNWAWSNRSYGGEDAEFDMSDLGDIFEDFFSGGARPTRNKKDLRRGKDIQVDVEIPL